MKRGAVVWLCGVAALAAMLAALLAHHRLQIDSDLLSLLPAPQRDPVNTAAMQRLATLGQRHLVLLIGTSSDSRRTRAAAAAAQSLVQSKAFTHVIANTNDLASPAQRQKLKAMYFQHRFHLLAPVDAAALAQLAGPPSGDDAQARAHFIDRAKANLYGLGIGSGSRFSDDPLGLASAYRDAVTAGALGKVRIATNGSLYVRAADGRRYSVLFAQSRRDSFNISAQANQLAALAHARAAARAVAPKADIIASAVVRHAAAATRRARHEVTLIGTGSLVGILILMVWAFGSIRPFVLSVVVIAGGVLLATVVTGLVFGNLNIITLVFGASLVGVAVDYCLHLFAQRWHTPAPRAALHHVLPAVSLGLLTSVLAYGGMAVAPFPGLRQIAVFAASGLVGAWLGVILLLPATAGPAPRSGSAIRCARGWLLHGAPRMGAAHRRWLLGALAIAFALCATIAVLGLNPDDDVRILYNPPPNLQQADTQVASLLGASIANRAIIIHGKTPDAVLDTEAAIVQALAAPATPVARVQAITRAYPPPAMQRRNYNRLAHTLYAADGPVPRLLAGAGFKPAAIQAHLQDFRAHRKDVLSFDQWLASPASAGLRDLWLGKVGQQWASMVRVREVDDQTALTQIVASHKNATLINRVAEVSALIGRYRHLTTWLLIGAYGLAWLLLCWPFGALGALTTLMPPMLASVAVAALFALTGWPFSLFNLLAMILLLGLGADYGIFLRMADTDQAPAMLAVALSAATTLLAFGLLAFSATPALHGFGLTLSLGLAITFLLASLIGGQPGRTQAG